MIRTPADVPFVCPPCTRLYPAAGCGCGSGNGPSGPTPNPARISRTKFLAFGDSFTAGEVTNPTSALPSGLHKLILVPAASYPTQLQSQLRIHLCVASGVDHGHQRRRAGRTNSRRQSAIPGCVRGEPAGSGAVDGRRERAAAGGTGHLDRRHADHGAGREERRRARVRRLDDPAGRGTAARRRRRSSELLAYNNTLQIMSTQESVTYVDLYNPMLADAATLIGSDGLHPTEAGYRRIADLFFAAIRTRARRTLITYRPRRH